MSHTEGKLTWGMLYISQPESDGKYKQIAMHPSGLTQADESQWECNARRLVACWNACRGIETEALEDALSITSQPFFESAMHSEIISEDHGKLTLERDGLVKAADDLLSCWDDPGESEIGCYPDLFEKFEALRRARAGTEEKP